MKRTIFIGVAILLFCVAVPEALFAQKKQNIPLRPGSEAELRADLQKISDDAAVAYNEKKLREKEYKKIAIELDKIGSSLDKAMLDDILNPREKESIAKRLIATNDLLKRYLRANGFYQ